jgi:16S rRNA (guanine527-N7)-methyltransferase
MMSHDISVIERYFPRLTETQHGQLGQLPHLYQEWNAKINVISRKDTDNIVEHHLLHSLAIARFISFAPGTKIVDVGTGGGLPGIPLAILFPDCSFTLIDGTGKKVHVAQAIADAVGLDNVRAIHVRAEDFDGRYHFVVSRAAMDLSDLRHRSAHLIENREQLNALPNGIIALKGGDLTDEIAPFRKQVEVTEISGYYPDLDYFSSKKIIYLPLH